MKRLICLLIVPLAACSTPDVPNTPEQKLANQAAGFEYAATRCTKQAGGFSDLKNLRDLAEQKRNEARALGATSENFAVAGQSVRQRMGALEIIAGKDETCSELLSELARFG